MRTTGIFLALALLLSGCQAIPSKNSNPSPPPPNNQSNTPTQPDNQAITAYHRFANGLHTYEGTITTPTPCYQLQSSAEVAESFPEQATLIFTTSPTADICIQVLAPQSFKVSFQASSEVLVSAKLNNQPVELRVIEQ